MRDLVFISYAHEDHDIFEKLRSHLKAFKSNQEILAWSDQEIPTGYAWATEIKSALSRAQAVILLVSRHFFASDFIRENELPEVLRAAEAKELTIHWIPVSFSNYSETPLAAYLAAADPERPLRDLSEAKQDRVLVEICHALKHSTWSLRIVLDKIGPAVEWCPNVSGKVTFKPKGGEKVHLKHWLQSSGLQLVPYVFSPRSGWWAQKQVEPDANGKFSGKIYVGKAHTKDETFTIVVCAVSQVTWGKGTPMLPEVRIESNRLELERK
jgi:hypothetical protein